jgi:hypothetical protein
LRPIDWTLSRRSSRGDHLGCVNPEFYEVPVDAPTFRVIAQISAAD